MLNALSVLELNIFTNLEEKLFRLLEVSHLWLTEWKSGPFLINTFLRIKVAAFERCGNQQTNSKRKRLWIFMLSFDSHASIVQSSKDIKGLVNSMKLDQGHQRRLRKATWFVRQGKIIQFKQQTIQTKGTFSLENSLTSSFKRKMHLRFTDGLHVIYPNW